MGRLARILSFVRVTRHDTPTTDVKSDPGGGANITPQHMADAGDDSHPLPEDYAAVVGVTSSRSVTVGYLDPTNTPVTQAGEKRIYSRDADSGVTVAQAYLKNDGTVIISNAIGIFTVAADGTISGVNDNGSFRLLASGDFNVNGAIIDTAGNITSPGKVQGVIVEGTSSSIAAGKELAGHKHGGVETGSGTTGANQ